MMIVIIIMIIFIEANASDTGQKINGIGPWKSCCIEKFPIWELFEDVGTWRADLAKRFWRRT